MHKILFLSNELSSYWLAGLKALETKAQLQVIHYPINSEAPFQFNLPANFQSKGECKDWIKEVNEFSPDLIICSGWADKDYLNICAKFRRKIPVILGIDNPWCASLKQKLNVFLKHRLQKYFSNAWGAGPSQVYYLKKLGFKKAVEGFYSADTSAFNSIGKKRLAINPKPKFICIARYIPQKNYILLWEAFCRISDRYPNWELNCIGSGEQFTQRMIHPKINHHGFVQPKDIDKHLVDAGAFIFPSTTEHWGVVVHEMAAAGLPLLLSSKVEARKKFLIENENGFSFDPFSVDSIERAITNYIQLPEIEREEMSKKSRELGLSYTPEIWANRVLSFLD